MKKPRERTACAFIPCLIFFFFFGSQINNADVSKSDYRALSYENMWWRSEVQSP